MDINQVMIEGVLNKIKEDIETLAEIYDSRDLFGIAYKKFADKIIDDVLGKYTDK